MSAFSTAEIRQWLVSRGYIDPSSYQPIPGMESAIYIAAGIQNVADWELDAAMMLPPGTIAGYVASRGWAPLTGATSTVSAPAPAPVTVAVVNPAPAPVVAAPPPPAPAPAPVTVAVVNPAPAPVTTTAATRPPTVAEARQYLINLGYVAAGTLQVRNRRGVYDEAVRYDVGSDALGAILNVSGSEVRAVIVSEGWPPLPRDVAMGVSYPTRAVAQAPVPRPMGVDPRPDWLVSPDTPGVTASTDGSKLAMIGGAALVGLLLLRRS